MSHDPVGANSAPFGPRRTPAPAANCAPARPRYRADMPHSLWMPSVLLSFTATSFAIVDANSTTNTSDPGGGVPWANVGSVNGGSGTYLGNGWVLTAAHVGPGPIAFDSGTFQPDGRVIRLSNPDTSLADMLLYHLVLTPGLTGSVVSSSTPAIGSLVDLVGYGRIRGSAEQSFSTEYGPKSGFYWSPNGTKSYGRNLIQTGVTTRTLLGVGSFRGFILDFTPPDAQVATGDSGGAVFYKNSATWELAGMIEALASFVYPLPASVYGDESWIMDLPTYKSQIDALVSSTAGGASWTGANGSTWADANWSSSPVPGAANNVHTATFNSAGNGQTTINLGAGVTLNTVLFDTATAAAYTIGSGAVGSQTLTLENGGAITTSSTVTNGQLVNAAVVLGTDRSAQTYTISNNATTPATALTVAGNITGAASGGTAGAKTLAVLGAGDTDLTGGIAKGGATSLAVTKAGTGTLNLAAGSVLDIDSLTANDGTTAVNSALGAGTSVTVNDTGGGAATSLKFGSVSQTLASLTIGAGATVTFTSGPASFTASTSGKTAGFGSKQPSGGLVPEPGTTGLLLAGALSVLARRTRRTG
ncbi:MAG: PEP-CTERM sorting domain-containing protein [Verrucomicrobia bacterium]|nr:MAG: PEP-CTERM sorting domain-containing protein [Verrucomicrobiota bacterium]